MNTSRKRPPVRILLDDVADAMDRRLEDPGDMLLDRDTGDVVFAPDPDVTGFDDPDLSRALEDDPKRFVPIPRSESHSEYDWMDSFARTLDDDDVRERLLDALAGKGAFGRFRNALREFPDVRDRWHAERTERFVGLATEWLTREAIAFTAERRQLTRETAEQEPKTPPLPLKIAHMLILGDRADGEPGRERRVVAPLTRSPRELFKILARDLCATTGVAWRKRFVSGTNTFELDGTRVSHDERSVYVDVAIPQPIVELFRGRRR